MFCQSREDGPVCNRTNVMLLSSSYIIFRQIGIAYVSATSSAVAVSVGLNTLVKVGKAPARPLISVNCNWKDKCFQQSILLKYSDQKERDGPIAEH